MHQTSPDSNLCGTTDQTISELQGQINTFKGILSSDIIDVFYKLSVVLIINDQMFNFSCSTGLLTA